MAALGLGRLLLLWHLAGLLRADLRAAHPAVTSTDPAEGDWATPLGAEVALLTTEERRQRCLQTMREQVRAAEPAGGDSDGDASSGRTDHLDSVLDLADARRESPQGQRPAVTPRELPAEHPADLPMDLPMELPMDLPPELPQLLPDGGPARGRRGCETTWDGVMCWPATAAGRRRTLPCFHEFNGVLYDANNTGSRLCLADGRWAEQADYSRCLQPLPLSEYDHQEPIRDNTSAEAAAIIYFVGYTISVLALTVATAIFRHFTELHCARNIIHTNLFVSFILTGALWIVVLSIKLEMAATTPVSCILMIFLQYFHVTTFFWMFVEGLYLYILVVRTFRVDRIRVYLYPLIGWGLPLLAVTAWSLVKAFTTISTTEDGKLLANGSYVRGLEPPLEHSFFSDCPWLVPSGWDWIHVGPSLLVLACNAVFLTRIMFVLITKLRSTNSAEAQQYKKAAKALLVLLPLLGLTYILVLVSPTKDTDDVIYYMQAVLISSQGFTVSMLYCFCNTEVRHTIRTHYIRWRTKTLLNKTTTNAARQWDSLRELKPSRGTSATEISSLMTLETDTV